jgi:hypothetical protein
MAAAIWDKMGEKTTKKGEKKIKIDFSGERPNQSRRPQELLGSSQRREKRYFQIFWETPTCKRVQNSQISPEKDWDPTGQKVKYKNQRKKAPLHYNINYNIN